MTEEELRTTLSDLTRLNSLITFYRTQEQIGRTANTTIERVALIRIRIIPSLIKLRDELEISICSYRASAEAKGPSPGS